MLLLRRLLYFLFWVFIFVPALVSAAMRSNVVLRGTTQKPWIKPPPSKLVATAAAVVVVAVVAVVVNNTYVNVNFLK